MLEDTNQDTLKRPSDQIPDPGNTSPRKNGVRMSLVGSRQEDAMDENPKPIESGRGKVISMLAKTSKKV